MNKNSNILIFVEAQLICQQAVIALLGRDTKKAKKYLKEARKLAEEL